MKDTTGTTEAKDVRHGRLSVNDDVSSSGDSASRISLSLCSHEVLMSEKPSPRL